MAGGFFIGLAQGGKVKTAKRGHSVSLQRFPPPSARERLAALFQPGRQLILARADLPPEADDGQDAHPRHLIDPSFGHPEGKDNLFDRKHLRQPPSFSPVRFDRFGSSYNI